jgi:hypothetical protein
MRVSEVVGAIKPFVVRWIGESGGGRDLMRRRRTI